MFGGPPNGKGPGGSAESRVYHMKIGSCYHSDQWLYQQEKMFFPLIGIHYLYMKRW